MISKSMLLCLILIIGLSAMASFIPRFVILEITRELHVSASVGPQNMVLELTLKNCTS